MSALAFYPITGDGFQPRLRPGSGVLAAPVDRYRFDGIYVLKDGGIYCAEKFVGRPVVRMWLENPAYGSHEVDLEWFNTNVEAMAVAEVNVRIRDWSHYLGGSAQALLPAPVAA